MKPFLPCIIVLVAFVLSGITAPCAAGGILGQVDDLEDGTTQNWSSGRGASLTNIASGGPADVNDNFLQLSRTLSPFHLTTANTSQWAGDYTGVAAMEMDLNAIVTPSLNGVRIMVLGPGGAFTSTVAQSVAQGWQHYSFSLDAVDMTRVFGSSPNWTDPGAGVDDLGLTLSSVSHLLIRNDPTGPTPVGDHPAHVIGTLGIDNIEAAPVPEPATITLLVVALAVTILRLRRKP